jgi:putative transposase
MESATTLSHQVGLSEACWSLGVPRSSYYRAQKPKAKPMPRSKPKRALSDRQKIAVRDVLNSDRFCDRSPRQVYATLLDEGSYLCHWRTMYRVLADYDEVRERRNVLRHPLYEKPELLATAPNELWSWDITKLRGSEKWTCYHLYVLLDVYSRYVVGWMVAPKESSLLAKELIETSCRRQGIDRDGLILHSDRGPSMTSKTVAQLLVDLGVEKSHSRPHVSNDNPYSEAQFKTMKYRGDYPKRFGSIEDARSWARRFFRWYNQEHHHTGLGLLPPAVVHYGRAEDVLAARQRVLSRAYDLHPERFVRGLPQVPSLPEAVWINKPKEATEAVAMSESVADHKKNPLPNLSLSLGCGYVVKPDGDGVSASGSTSPVCPHIHDREEVRSAGAVPH